MSKATERANSQVTVWNGSTSVQPGTAHQRAGRNRTQQRVIDRHDTNITALVGEVDEADVAIGGLGYLTRRSIHERVATINEGYDFVRAQEFTADQARIEREVEESLDISGRSQSKILQTAANALELIVGRPLVIEVRPTNRQLITNAATSAITDGLRDD